MFTHGDVSWLKMSSQGPDAMCSNSVTGSVDFVNCQTKVCMIITVLHKMEHKQIAFLISKKIKSKGMSKMLQDNVYCIELSVCVV